VVSVVFLASVAGALSDITTTNAVFRTVAAGSRGVSFREVQSSPFRRSHLTLHPRSGLPRHRSPRASRSVPVLLTTSTPDAGDGRTLIAFGDSFTCSGAGNGWYSYALFESRDTDPTDGLYVDGTVDGSRSGEFLPTSLKVRGVEYTKIPTSGIEVGGEQYVDFIPVKSWGQAGMWTTNYAQTVVSRAGPGHLRRLHAAGPCP
jgi:hypothetical protein